MSIILGVLAAASWGQSYFLLRFPTKRIGALGTFVPIQIVSFLLLSIYLVISGELLLQLTENEKIAWVWAGLIAVLSSLSLLAYYRALEIGVLSIVAPISASYAAITVLLAFFSGETLQWISVIGIVTVLLGVILTAITYADDAGYSRSKVIQGALWAFGSAIGFGISFWILGFKVTPSLGSFVPTWLSRIVAIGIMWGVAIQQDHWNYFRPPRGVTLYVIVFASILETAGFVFTNLGYEYGRISIVSVLSSQFSAVTVVLAWYFLSERLVTVQWFGIGLICAGNVLINV